MIIGSARGRGGAALAGHLCDAKAANDLTQAGASRGLVRWGVHDQVEELTELTAHSRHAAPSVTSMQIRRRTGPRQRGVSSGRSSSWSSVSSTKSPWRSSTARDEGLTVIEYTA